jgi:peptide/nickel transport system substrate-binding protein
MRTEETVTVNGNDLLNLKGPIERREFLRRAGLVGAGLALPTGFLTACGSDSGGGSSSGGVLSVGATDWLPDDFYLDRSLGNHLLGFAQMAWSLFMSRGSGYEYRYGIASDYEVSGDGLVHTVTVRDGMTFHDGSPIDAEAVAANLRGTFFRDDPLHRGDATYLHVLITLGDPPIVRSVDVVGRSRVAVTLTEFRADIRTALAFILIMNPEILKLKDYGTNVEALGRAGSGPFRLTGFRADDFAEFTRYDDFFEEVKPSRVRIQEYADPGAVALALTKGDVGVANGLSKADYDRFARSGYTAVTSDPAVNVDLVFSYPKDPAFADPRVRRAVTMAMNREAYTERFFNTGTAIVSSQPIMPPGIPGYVEGVEPLPYDPEAARALLQEAGATGIELTLDGAVAQPPISSVKAMLEAIAADLGRVGIDTSVRVLDGAANDELVTSRKVDAFIFAPGGQPDPFILFDLFFAAGTPYGPGEQTRYPQIARALRAAHLARDVGERDELLRSIMQISIDETLLVPIAVVDYSAMTAESVKDFPLSCTALDTWNVTSV